MEMFFPKTSEPILYEDISDFLWKETSLIPGLVETEVSEPGWLRINFNY